MNILDTIVQEKRKSVVVQQSMVSLEMLKASTFYNRTPFSLVKHIQENNEVGIIAEFKRKSPSKGNIYADADVVQVTTAYQSAQASAVSILTDTDFFGGSNQDLIDARPLLKIPILRKDFIIDPYQIHEAKSIGADLILLIAACLTVEEVDEYAQLAKSLGMEVLLELHDEEELGHISPHVDLVGINNRSLKTFKVDIDRSLKMASLIPNNYLKVAESGIDDPSLIRLFKKNGFQAFLIGEFFMKTHQPGQALADFIEKI
ncbi:MAG: indole-3-glycerol phosphate synthase TrpC [Bacteroidota bacterium]|jgi:indole-3-glycerol phosphate synthase